MDPVRERPSPDSQPEAMNQRQHRVPISSRASCILKYPACRYLFTMPVGPDFFVGKRAEAARLFNIIKNRRRLVLLEILAQRSCGLPELQHGMRRFGFDHSQTTILGYLTPLLETGLVQAVAGRYALTNRGLAAKETLAGKEIAFGLPENSNCDEEFLLIALETDESVYERLLGAKPAGDFGRTVRRLEEIGLLHREKPASRALYRRSDSEPVIELSATEKRVYGLIPGQGATVHELSEKASLSLRRTFKYLRLLREKGLVFAEKPSAKLTLTPNGKDSASLLGNLAKALESPVEVLSTTLQGSPQPLASSPTGTLDALGLELPYQLHEARFILDVRKPPCQLLKPLDAPGLSGQRLYRCEKRSLTIGENAEVCESCDR